MRLLPGIFVWSNVYWRSDESRKISQTNIFPNNFYSFRIECACELLNMCAYHSVLRNFNMFHRRSEKNDVTTLYDLLFRVILVREKEAVSGACRGITCSAATAQWHYFVTLVSFRNFMSVIAMENSRTYSN